MNEYKIAKFWAIFTYVFSPLLFVLFAWMLSLPFENGDYTPNASWILIPIGLAMMTLVVIGVLDVYKTRLRIDDEKIEFVSTFSHRVLYHKDIKGYTVNEYYIFVEPIDKNKKRIKISKYMGKYDDILLYLSYTYQDLDVLAAQEEEKAILKDLNLGWSEATRQQKLLTARRVATVINWMGGLAAAWAFFYPTPYQWALLANLIIPCLALLAIILSNGLIQFDEPKGSAYPSVIYAIIFPSLVLFVRAVLDYSILSFEHVWPNALLISLALTGLLFLKKNKRKKEYYALAGLAFVMFGYGFGTTIHINCFYDASKAEVYSTKVLDKHISNGKTTIYYLNLGPWGPQKEAEEVSVDEALYHRTELGETVNVYLFEGLLDIPWYAVEDR